MDKSLYDTYYKRAVEHCKDWGVTDPHIVSITQSVMMTRDNYMQGGGFVTSVVNNDLRTAVSTADTKCINHLRVIVSAMYHSFITVYDKETTE